MPEKEGAEEKSTKSVVNKKQKQMMGEEGYDIARDQGRVRPSKDKKDATSYPPSEEMKKTQIVNTGPSAFELIKKKYKGQIMKVGKKKVKKEELDLTQVAEAFGGYIIESIDKPKFFNKKTEDEFEDSPEKEQKIGQRGNPRRIRKTYSDTKAKAIRDIVRARDEKGGTPSQRQTATDILNKVLGKTKSDSDTVDVDGVRVSEKDLRSGSNIKNPEEFANEKGEKPKRGNPATRRKSVATPPAFATKTGESGGPLPVSMRNRRVPKTSSLSPNVKATSIVKPKVGALAKTDQETSAITKGGIDYKALQDKIKTVSLGKGMEIVDEPKTRTQGGRIGKDTGRTVDTTAFEVQPDQLTGSKPRTMPQLMPAKPSMLDRLLNRTRKNKTKTGTETKTDTETKLLPPSSKPDYSKLLDPKRNRILNFPPFPTPSRKSDEPKTQSDGGANKIVGGGGGRKGGARVTTSGGGETGGANSITKLARFAKKNPATAFLTFDTIRKYIPSRSPFGVVGGRAGTRSAAR